MNIDRVFFEKDALEYPMGKESYEKLKKAGYQIEFLKSHNRVTGIPGKSPREAFFHGKNTLVVGVRRSLDFATCKPSAHFQLPLVTGCQGICEYCYLHTQMGKKPYTRIYVNIEEILAKSKKYIEERKPDITVFEAAATSDPLPVEAFTGALARAIEFFAQEEFGRLRFVSKFANVDSLLDLDHQQHSRIRFSINSYHVIKRYEHRTPRLAERLDALAKITEAGYPSGVIIAPVVLYDGWQNDYLHLLKDMRSRIKPDMDSQVDFEIISHRFTRRARSNILEVFPDTDLPMDEEQDRKFKYGQFAYGKFVYSKEKLDAMKDFFENEVRSLFPASTIEYII